jgi:hypothetical protein
MIRRAHIIIQLLSCPHLAERQARSVRHRHRGCSRYGEDAGKIAVADAQVIPDQHNGTRMTGLVFGGMVCRDLVFRDLVFRDLIFRGMGEASRLDIQPHVEIDRGVRDRA